MKAAVFTVCRSVPQMALEVMQMIASVVHYLPLSGLSAASRVNMWQS